MTCVVNVDDGGFIWEIYDQLTSLEVLLLYGKSLAREVQILSRSYGVLLWVKKKYIIHVLQCHEMVLYFLDPMKFVVAKTDETSNVH